MSDRVLVIGLRRGVHRAEAVENYLKNRFPNFHSYSQVKYPKFDRLLRPLFYLAIIIILRPKIVLYHAMNDRYSLMFHLARLLGSRCVLDLYTLRSDIISQNGQYCSRAQNSWRFNKSIRIDRRKIAGATDILSLTVGEIDHVKKLIPQAKGKRFHVVPLVVPDIIFNKTKYTPDNSRVVRIAWWGQASKLHGLEYIIDEFRNLPKGKFSLTLYDNSAKRLDFLRKSLQINETNIFLNSSSKFYNEVFSEVYANFDVVLGVFGNTELARLVVPNKVVEAFQLGLPIITRDSSGIDDFSLEGVTQIPYEPGALRRALESVCVKRKEYTRERKFFDVDTFWRRMDRVFSDERN